ncbi:hypothetical protein TCAL_09110 [Tigriopus californicus]|uniref:G-protein coupled receptors family 1 profile domain-containing protein n=1 Tax=Tigriopus californicus TaxID=6832 RepID=A0A553P5P6_TIGCA|nr:hypothetical protein TCAL_09110 [Tigriopus californicus]
MARRHSKMAVNLTLLNSTNASSEDYVYDYDIDDALYDFDWMELGPSLCVYSITFLAGILGNLLILVSVIRHTHVKSSPVNVFLASLATADLMLIVICLPLKVFKLFTYTWTLGLFNCKLLYFMQSVSAIGSVINLTALSFERYYAIVHPLKSQYLCTISKAKKTILVAWIAAFFLAIPVLFAQIHLEVGVRYKAYWCVRDIDNPAKWRAQELYLLLIILVIPSVVMSFCYGKIIREVCQVVRQRSNLTQNYGKPR